MKPELKKALGHRTVIMVTMITAVIISFSCTNSQTETIYISGSSELLPLSQTLSDEYYIATDGRINTVISATNAETGFKELCTGKAHITTSARPVTQSEITQCSDSSIKMIELPMANLPLIVATNSVNQKSPQCLNSKELKDLWTGNNDLDLTLYKPETRSDLSKYLVNMFGETGENISNNAPTKNSVLLDLTNDINGIAYLDYLDYQSIGAYVSPVGLKTSSKKCSIPSYTGVNDGSYDAFNRTLFLYIRHDLLKQDYLSGFAELALSKESIQIMSNIGYTTLDSNAYAENRIRLAERTTGSRYTSPNQKNGEQNR